MRVAETTTITLESSTVTASTESEYASGTTYAEDDVVKVSFESDGTTPLTPVKEYISLANSNTDNYPPDFPAQWSEIGASNRWKMFDGKLNTATEDTIDIEVDVAADRTDIVALFRLQASSIKFELVKDSSVVKTETINLKTIPGTGWYSWLNDLYEYKTKALWSYPKYPEATLNVVIYAQDGTVKCGEMVIGSQYRLGGTEWGAMVSIDDYSTISTDSATYLPVELVQGDFSDRSGAVFWVENTDVDRVRNKLTAMRGKLSIFDLNNEESDFDSFIIYGYPKSFDIIIPGPSISKCNLEIGGAT